MVLPFQVSGVRELCNKARHVIITESVSNEIKSEWRIVDMYLVGRFFGDGPRRSEYMAARNNNNFVGRHLRCNTCAHSGFDRRWCARERMSRHGRIRARKNNERIAISQMKTIIIWVSTPQMFASVASL